MMDHLLQQRVKEAKGAALEVLLNNAHGPFDGLFRTAAWGYPEPYTRDIMLSSLGILASENGELITALREVLIALAKHQTARGHISSLASDPTDLGASDTTPLFILAAALYRREIGGGDFLDSAMKKAITWMEYQSPGDEVIVGQLPTSDWRDEQWVLGFGLFVNTIVYAYLRLLGYEERAERLRQLMCHLDVRMEVQHHHLHEGLVVPNKPYYALWSYKLYNSERFDLLGNSLAVIFGLASPVREKLLISWIEDETAVLRESGKLGVDFPPNFFPYIQPGDPDWIPRYERFNRPGEYHNGGIWPYVCGFYVVAALAAGFTELAEHRLAVLTDLVRSARDGSLAFGFNEWIRAQDGQPCGQDWQTWSAAMYLYAASCVEEQKVLFLGELRERRNESC